MKQHAATKGKTIMSQDTSATTTTTNKVSISYLDTGLIQREKEIAYAFVPATTIEDGMERMGSDPTKICAAFNVFLEQEAQELALANAGVTDQIDRKVALEFAAPFRQDAQFAIVKDGPDGSINNRGVQTERIFAFLAAIPPFMASLVARSKK